MKLSNINTAALRNLIKLTERKESLVREIEKIEAQLASLISGRAVRASGKRRGRPRKNALPKAAKAAGRGGKRARRGGLKTKILAALKAAGDAGVKVTELSKKLGVKNQNVHVWFSSTGKKHPEIKRIGKGHFKIQSK